MIQPQSNFVSQQGEIAIKVTEIFNFHPGFFFFKFLLPGGLWHNLQIISSCWELRYGCLDTLNIKISPLFQILQRIKVGCKICDGRKTDGTTLVLYQISQILISESLYEYYDMLYKTWQFLMSTATSILKVYITKILY